MSRQGHSGFVSSTTQSPLSFWSNSNQGSVFSSPKAPVQMPNNQPTTPQVPSTFISSMDVKKNESHELREALKLAINNRDEESKLDTVTRIISCMTSGLDVSGLFDSMIMICNTRDLLLKKMIYLYLANYSRENEQLAIMGVNSVLKDTEDPNPMIRGMALRWLSSLSSPQLVEYMRQAVQKGLNDQNAYVRLNATLACAKIYHLNSEFMLDNEVIHRLKELVLDKDPAVIVNALRALEEILQDDFELTQNVVVHLLQKLSEFNPWGRYFVLSLLVKYQPTGDSELFGILNLLDNLFASPYSSIVLATTHLFLTYTQTKPTHQEHVYLRIKNPILGLMVGASVELIYVVLSHILLITKRVQGLFSSDYKIFYTKDKEPLYLRLMKVKVLQAIAVDTTANDIINELSAYVVDREPELAKRSIHAISKIAIRVPKSSLRALEVLLSFLELEQMQHVLANTLIAMRDMLKCFPAQAQDIIPRLAQYLDIVQESNAVAAITTMIGEYGEIIPDGPYILEQIMEDWDKHDAVVRNQLIIGTLKLFFKRPCEVKPILGTLFVKALDDYSNPDVHDRALFYYRLLSQDINLCQKLLTTPKEPVTNFVEEQDGLEVDKLFEEFNTLSVIYGEGSERFIKAEHEDLEEENEQFDEYNEEEPIYKGEDEEGTTEVPRQQTYAAPDLSSGFGFVAQGPELNPNATMDPQTFEKTWKSLAVVDKIQTPHAFQTIDLQQIDSKFIRRRFKSVAKGGANGMIRFFLYCQESQSGAYVLVELVYNTSTKNLTVQFKSASPDVVQLVRPEFDKVLQEL